MNPEPLYVVKADGTREPFDVKKLQQSLMLAGASEKAIQDIVEHVQAELSQNITTHDIYKHAFALLHTEAKPVVARYSLKRAVMELGPSGFPFEDFVAEIFRAQGFEAVTDQTVKGFCVAHEIDVVAWKDDRMIMVEAKFHNELGIKSDLKIALYVKARFDDLRKMKFNYGGKERDLDEGWLVTNTKFTTTAIEYGSCQGGMKMFGWNYPPVGNLHDMIIEAKLHPLTCLTTLNGREKKVLLDQGVVLCKTILDNPDLLLACSLDETGKEKVLEEIQAL